MKIKLILKKQQQSIFKEEISEVLSIFEVEIVPSPGTELYKKNVSKITGLASLESNLIKDPWPPFKNAAEQHLYVSQGLYEEFNKNKDFRVELDKQQWLLSPELTRPLETHIASIRSDLRFVSIGQVSLPLAY